MSKLSKDQYFKRELNAAARMIENSKNQSLTQIQHEAIAFLCKARHELHSNKDQAIRSNENSLVQDLIVANSMIFESGLSPMSFIPIDLGGFIDIDTISELNLDEDDFEEDFENEYYRISNELEELNTKIEKYLFDIDSIHGTSYCPTGALRVV